MDFENMSEGELQVIQNKLTIATTNRLDKTLVALQKIINKQEDEINLIKNISKELEISNQKLEGDVITIKKELLVLDTRKDLATKLTTLVKKTAFKHTGIKSSTKYELMYKLYISNIYSVLKDRFEVPTYGRISVDDFDETVGIVKAWFPSKNLKGNIIKTLMTKLNNGTLPPHKEKALDLLIEELGGDIYAL